MLFSRCRFLCRTLFFLLLAATLFGCAAQKKPLTGLVPGREVETVQSSVSLSATSNERSTAGRGYFVFKAPSQFHLAVLSPFGQSILEAYIDRNLFTCLVPSRQIAYAGHLAELPEQSALKSLDLLQWVMAPAPFPVPAAPPGETVVVSGVRYFIDEIGMVKRKVNEEGDEVVYEGHRAVEGVPFPETVVIRNRYGATVRVTFEEPQLNRPVEASDLTPDFSGMTVLPLTEFRAL